MTIDFKITTWESVKVPALIENEIIALVEKGELNTSQDIFNYVEDKHPTLMHELDLIRTNEVDENITPTDNGGCPTIEIIDNNKVKWHNGE